MVGFDECQVEVRVPDFEGESGEASSGAEVEDSNTPGAFR